MSQASPRRRVPSRRTFQPEFVHARTCYDHLAGEVAVAIVEAMVKRRWLRREGDELQATGAGLEALRAWGIDVDAARASKRPFARGCLDLTQRRPHLAGSLGAALLDHFVAQRWIQRSPGSRSVSITARGRDVLRTALGVAI